MPSVSRNTAATKVTWDGVDIDHDALAPLSRGLPDDRAQLPRWGCVIAGRIGFRFADREETYEAGDTPLDYTRTEIVEFSPTAELDQTIPVVVGNLTAGGIAVEVIR